MKEIRTAYWDLQILNFREEAPTTAAPQIFSNFPSVSGGHPAFYPEDVEGTFMNTLNKTAGDIAYRRLHVLQDVMTYGLEIYRSEKIKNAKLLTVANELKQMREGAIEFNLESNKKLSEVYPWAIDHNSDISNITQIIFWLGFLQMIVLIIYLLSKNKKYRIFRLLQKNVKLLTCFVWGTNILSVILVNYVAEPQARYSSMNYDMCKIFDEGGVQ